MKNVAGIPNAPWKKTKGGKDRRDAGGGYPAAKYRCLGGSAADTDRATGAANDNCCPWLWIQRGTR
jgi:hypothetical protein